jgi:hypothetical protein
MYRTQTVKYYVREKVIAATIVAMLCPSFSTAGVQNVDPCFDKLPVGWRITKSFIASEEQTAAIGRKLGTRIMKLSNTVLSVQGQSIQVNIFECHSDNDAEKLHKTILQMKGHPAFCLCTGKTVIELVGKDVALATKTGYELGFVPKPTEVRYHIFAQIALLDKSDYMSFNKLSNLFFALMEEPNNERIKAQIAYLSKRFEFGRHICLRTCGNESTKPVYRFNPRPIDTQVDLARERTTYTFGSAPLSLGVPYVSVEAEITTRERAVLHTARKGDEALLAQTSFWPVDDPNIVKLMKRITRGYEGRKAKTEAILKWLTPGKNIQFGGPVQGSRWGVKEVIKKGYGQCWDFSDLFVTLCRASGIPCRQVGGWLYGSCGHIWAEVFLEDQTWQQVDPTGGSIVKCGIYHIPYFVTEDGNMPILYISMPKIEILTAR